MKIIELEEIDSTNEYCKRFDFGEDVAVVAERQLKGKGTNGRSFVSDEGGLYISLYKRYENFDFSNTFSIMINACVAVCKTVESFGVKPTVKWANDVLVNGRKICGTLIENRLGADGVCTSIVGIGLNVNNELPDELSEIATTLKEQKGKKVSLNAVRSRLIKNLKKEYSVEDYKAYVDWFGKNVYLDRGDERITAVALDVDAEGNLVCEIEGQIKKISSAEMKLRLTCKSI
ncbi:MAG: biotin--[acetyl-CoA-carboxylase] ligase [Clostridiales bacterium]|nr:biotin--[acetyl-CoA-carboxylase] ligase [Clostridiales bacterium]